MTIQKLIDEATDSITNEDNYKEALTYMLETIERLRNVLSHSIAWNVGAYGELAAHELLEMLDNPVD